MIIEELCTSIDKVTTLLKEGAKENLSPLQRLLYDEATLKEMNNCIKLTNAAMRVINTQMAYSIFTDSRERMIECRAKMKIKIELDRTILASKLLIE